MSSPVTPMQETFEKFLRLSQTEIDTNSAFSELASPDDDKKFADFLSALAEENGHAGTIADDAAMYDQKIAEFFAHLTEDNAMPTINGTFATKAVTPDTASTTPGPTTPKATPTYHGLPMKQALPSFGTCDMDLFSFVGPLDLPEDKTVYPAAVLGSSSPNTTPTKPKKSSAEIAASFMAGDFGFDKFGASEDKAFAGCGYGAAFGKAMKLSEVDAAYGVFEDELPEIPSWDEFDAKMFKGMKGKKGGRKGSAVMGGGVSKKSAGGEKKVGLDAKMLEKVVPEMVHGVEFDLEAFPFYA